MTAEISIMNSQGIAIAADSAVTIGNTGNYKTYYTAQKVFNLSKKHFVGIMIYGEVEFMNINMEIIINEFSKALGDRVFDTLEEYAKYLLVFLKNFKYVDTDQKEFLKLTSCSFFKEIKESYEGDISENYRDQEISKAQQSKILAGVLKKAREILENTTTNVNFTDDGFVEANKAIITKEVEEVFPDFTINDKTKEELMDLFLLDISKVEIGSWWYFHTGIVFAGYGDKELFPSTVDFVLYGKLGNNVLHTELSIKDHSSYPIHPYSQTNIITSFIMGIHPEFEYKIDKELDKLTKELTDITGKKYTEEISKKIKELKDKIESFQKTEFRDPVFDIVDSLPKSELAEMAEALVNITALRQHVSTELETVGGPTDVALITRTDGFVWIKKKQIFSGIQENK